MEKPGGEKKVFFFFFFLIEKTDDTHFMEENVYVCVYAIK
jgi:hypothetical protein